MGLSGKECLSEKGGGGVAVFLTFTAKRSISDTNLAGKLDRSVGKDDPIHPRTVEMWRKEKRREY